MVLVGVLGCVRRRTRERDRGRGWEWEESRGSQGCAWHRPVRPGLAGRVEVAVRVPARGDHAPLSFCPGRKTTGEEEVDWSGAAGPATGKWAAR